MSDIDYSKIGLKCGIEIHQQIDTEHKLFCKCRSGLSSSDPETEISRRLRAVAGEMGEIDVAAMSEFLRGRTFVYKTYPRETCLVETDEEPPHELNSDALDITLTISQLLKCEVPEEIHVMRKTVLDGSNTSGFQRTAIVGINGKLRTSAGDVGVTNVCVEEESAQILGREGNRVTYGLDRLGIPLVEIGTSPDITSPDQVREVAEKLGMIVRSTGRVKRGIGTIRQDVNVSVKGGARVEIKGAQELRVLKKLVENEAARQSALLEIRKDLRKAKFSPVKPEVVHVSHIFRDSKSKITRGKTTYSIHIPGFAGFLKRKLTPTMTLGNEIAGYVRTRSELRGIIHSDEDLEEYQLSREFEKLRKHMKVKKGDTLIIAAGDKKAVEKTMKLVCDRINYLVKGVPNEVRKARDDGNTEYLRPLPGAARLYPETDVPPIKVSRSRLKRIRKELPELIEDREKRMKKELRKKAGISGEMINQIVKSGKKELMEKLLKKGFSPKIVSSALTKEGSKVDKISGSRRLKVLTKIFTALRRGEMSKESVPEILDYLAEHPRARAGDAIEKIGAKQLSEREISEIAGKTVRENKNLVGDPRGEKVLFGLVMKKVRGKASAREVMSILKKELKRHH